MLLEKFGPGITILMKYAKFGEMNPIPNSFPNGAPNHSDRCYFSVEIGNQWVSEEDEATLRELGWVPEQDAQYWVFYN